MKNILNKYVCEIILLMITGYFFYFKSDYHAWNRMITGDGSGYYAYLPAVFIYHDLQFGFKQEVEQKYYPPDLYNHYINETDGKKVNKFSVGLAILWLPFFLLAHFLSFLLGLPADGYSVLYQFSIGLSAILYLYFGLKQSKQFLAGFKIPDGTIAFTLFVLALGTNIFYYTVFDPSLTHVYTFFLSSALFVLIQKYQTKHSRNILLLSGFILGLIVAVRPVNIVMVLAIPFLFENFSSFILFIKNCCSDIRRLTTLIVVSFLPLLLQIYFWHTQTGHWLVDTYVGEHFDFTHPHIISFLFSFKKGWFLYTPVALLSMTGFYGLYKHNRFKFIILLAFYLILIFILSSWWSWWYGWGFSIRPMIDFYSLLIVLLAFSIQQLEKNKIVQSAYKAVLVLLLCLNIAQSFQHRFGFVPGEGQTKEEYMNNLLNFTK